jgi:hypothetical protein
MLLTTRLAIIIIIIVVVVVVVVDDNKNDCQREMYGELNLLLLDVDDNLSLDMYR